jgi:hypothetical protein
MKLLFCADCQDIVRLIDHERTCECGRVGGKYIDQSEVEVFGGGVPFGILNADFDRALRERSDDWPGNWFGAFVIPRNAENVVNVPRA